MRYVCSMEFYSATRKNEIMLFAGKWMELENIILSKLSQDQKVKGSSYVEARLMVKCILSAYTNMQRERERLRLH
jgi:hypothetical protein